MTWDDEGESQVLRRQNRALRGVNKQLRKAQKRAQHKMDELFMHMCETPTDAEQALQRLWEESNLIDTCGPEDYLTIVDTILQRLEANKPTQNLLGNKIEEYSNSPHEYSNIPQGNGWINPGNGFIYQGNIAGGGLPNQ